MLADMATSHRDKEGILKVHFGIHYFPISPAVFSAHTNTFLIQFETKETSLLNPFKGPSSYLFGFLLCKFFLIFVLSLFALSDNQFR